MKSLRTQRQSLIGATLGAVLAASLGVPAWADRHDGDGERDGPRGDLTLEAMLERAGERFDAADTDGDGQVTQDEHDAQLASRVAERVAMMMERMDSDGDGLITALDRGYDRLTRQTGLEGELSQAQIETAMLAAAAERHGDSDTEYPLTRAAMEANVTAEFTALDTDGDGVLSREERPERGGRGNKGRKSGGRDTQTDEG